VQAFYDHQLDQALIEADKMETASRKVLQELENLAKNGEDSTCSLLH
jgi:hypothetical protein